MADEETKLNDRQTLFVKFYCETWNATESAKRAGYSEKTAYQQAHLLLKKLEIRAAIDSHIEAIIPKGEVVERLAAMARTSMGDFVTVQGRIGMIDLEKAEKAGKLNLLRKFKVTEDAIEIEPYDAQAALNSLGKMHGLFVERQEITGKDGGAVNIRVSDVRFMTDEQLEQLANSSGGGT